ncbi:MAG: HD domain-containing protein [Kiritimatiellae bacterium]|nr:HD domain-containing protein [Kiritimatiellia bacterium]
MIAYKDILAAYNRYVDTYRGEDGKLPEMMQLKLVHTAHVVDNARKIAAGEAFDADLAEAGAIAALLHDTGRYEQLKRYNTFRDADSVDHAVLSHEIVSQKGWVEDKAILDAVLFHNRRELPEGLDARTLYLSHLVRDADKLDIFRIIESLIGEGEAWRTDRRAFWNLAVEGDPNEAVVQAIEGKRSVDYKDVKTLADFVLIQVGWMISGLYFATARRLVRERGHLEFRRSFLKKLTCSPAIDRLCDMAGRELAI